MCCPLYGQYGSPELAELISSVTGWDLSWEEALKAGRRVLTLRQAFNARDGMTPDKFDLPRRIKEEPLPVRPALRRNRLSGFERGIFCGNGMGYKNGLHPANPGDLV